MNYQTGYPQYRQPIKWGVIILWFIFFFPVGFYFLVREYRQKRNFYEYGKMLKTTGIICLCIGIFYMIFFPFVLTTTSDGVLLTTSQKLGYGFMMLFVFGGIGIAFFINGIKKLKQASQMQTVSEQENLAYQSAEFESNHPFIHTSCPSCGAHIQGRKGILTKCEYCGSEYTID